MLKIEERNISPNYERPIDNTVKHPSIWLDETAHDAIADYEKAIELLKANDLVGCFALFNAKKHYWAGICDGNRFMRNPFNKD